MDEQICFLLLFDHIIKVDVKLPLKYLKQVLKIGNSCSFYVCISAKRSNICNDMELLTIETKL